MVETVVIVALVAVVAVLLVLAVYFKWFAPKKLRMVELGKQGAYIRFYPNPGFTVGGRHWCRHKRDKGY